MEISFLLGAGFSVPAKYPSRKDINGRLNRISHNEILIFSDGRAFFSNGMTDPNADWTNPEEKYFVEEFLDFYSAEVISKPEIFDYEVFFDYYSGLLNERTICPKFEIFADNFRKKYDFGVDNENLLDHFNDTYNQLLASYLKRKLVRVHLGKPYSLYAYFLNFIDDIKEQFDKIHFHTLNHDNLFEQISMSDAMVSGLSDGFKELGSPYFAEDNEGRKIRLKRFTNNFTEKFCLYKLHGSIDNYNFGEPSYKNHETVKIPWGIDYVTIFKEIVNEYGEASMYERYIGNYYPDFLSGSTEKIISYSKSQYYKSIFEHFSLNLKNSDVLISIGYGLMDVGINEIIRDVFLTHPSKVLVIITPVKPQSDLFDLNNVKYYGVGLGIEQILKSHIDELLVLKSPSIR